MACFHNANRVSVRGKIAGLPARGSDKFIDDWVALEEDSLAQLRGLTGGRGADIVLDTVGGTAMFETALTHLRTRGVLVEISATGGAPSPHPHRMHTTQKHNTAHSRHHA